MIREVISRGFTAARVCLETSSNFPFSSLSIPRDEKSGGENLAPVL